ncbi:MAG TPA: YciI family protein [Gemmatimonadales bacterium]|nr:YciI family protein [Gemmatimonadales bacterium]
MIGVPEVAMFIVELTYKAPLAQIDAHMRAHVAFLKKYYASGNFVISGRQIPRTGGIIVALAEAREQIASIMAEDPFCRNGLADVRIIEFRASQRADDIPSRVA